MALLVQHGRLLPQLVGALRVIATKFNPLDGSLDL
jgi:hypothetical protein